KEGMRHDEKLGRIGKQDGKHVPPTNPTRGETCRESLDPPGQLLVGVECPGLPKPAGSWRARRHTQQIVEDHFLPTRCTIWRDHTRAWHSSPTRTRNRPCDRHSDTFG